MHLIYLGKNNLASLTNNAVKQEYRGKEKFEIPTTVPLNISDIARLILICNEINAMEVLEFGSGYATAAIANSVKATKNKLYKKTFINTNTECVIGEIVSESEEYIEIYKHRIPSFLADSAASHHFEVLPIIYS